MIKTNQISNLLLAGFVFISCLKLTAHEMNNSTSTHSSAQKSVNFTIRLGQGGFQDDRSPLGKLGGGQLALDVKLAKFPVAFSLTGEYYTNSADPTHPYEISDVTAVNLLYMTKPFKTERVTFFAGSGIGWLQVPKGEDYPDKYERGVVCNAEVGINAIVFRKIGLYGMYKCLYAKNDKRIDFYEHIFIVGITFNLGI